MIRCAGGQVRATLGGPYALDFSAILALAEAMGAGTTFLADVLPTIERTVIAAYKRQAEGNE